MTNAVIDKPATDTQARLAERLASVRNSRSEATRANPFATQQTPKVEAPAKQTAIHDKVAHALNTLHTKTTIAAERYGSPTGPSDRSPAAPSSGKSWVNSL